MSLILSFALIIVAVANVSALTATNSIQVTLQPQYTKLDLGQSMRINAAVTNGGTGPFTYNYIITNNNYQIAQYQTTHTSNSVLFYPSKEGLTAGSYNIKVTVTNSTSATATNSINMTVDPWMGGASLTSNVSQAVYGGNILLTSNVSNTTDSDIEAQVTAFTYNVYTASNSLVYSTNIITNSKYASSNSVVIDTSTAEMFPGTYYANVTVQQDHNEITEPPEIFNSTKIQLVVTPQLVIMFVE